MIAGLCLNFVLPGIPVLSFALGFHSAVSATSAFVYSPACSSLIVVAQTMVWVDAAIS